VLRCCVVSPSTRAHSVSDPVILRFSCPKTRFGLPTSLPCTLILCAGAVYGLFFIRAARAAGDSSVVEKPALPSVPSPFSPTPELAEIFLNTYKNKTKNHRGPRLPSRLSTVFLFPSSALILLPPVAKGIWTLPPRSPPLPLFVPLVERTTFSPPLSTGSYDSEVSPPIPVPVPPPLGAPTPAFF